MSEFKKGDRVRGNNYRNPTREDGWREGVVHSVGTLTTILHTESGNYLGVVWTSTLEAVDFKVGDRVKGERSLDYGGEVTGKIIAVHPDRHTFRYEYLVEVDGKPGHTAYIHKDTAVRVDDEQDLADWECELLKTSVPKPEVPAVGSKVRVTYEGVVKEHTSLGGFRLETDEDKGIRIYVGAAKHTTEVLEKPKPKPCAEGTLIKTVGGTAVRAAAKDVWLWTASGVESISLSDEYVRGAVERDKATILYDPAAT